MIEIQTRIHDKFSLELKLGFVSQPPPGEGDFAVNTWIFVPNSLDINRQTYDKQAFYRDMKSNIRLITPVYLLRDLASRHREPFSHLEASFRHLASSPVKTTADAYEYHIRMFVSIMKSALREEINHVADHPSPGELNAAIDEFIANTTAIARHYRDLKRIIHVPGISERLMNYYRFGDEFLSNLIEQHTFKLLERLQQTAVQAGIREKMAKLITSETSYKRAQGYRVVEKESSDRNRDLLFRLNLLKKYAENELFLTTNKRRDSVLIEQFYLSLAAGISMVFATAVAFSFQQKYGNLTMPFFVALVVSYMLKDRIKELTRYYFAHKLGSRFFDNRTNISLSGQAIGWSKEGMDFIAEENVPPEVMRIRDRSAILEADNRNNREKIVLYRRFIRIQSELLAQESRYPTLGVHDILRFNVSGFISKMDNPMVPLYVLDENKNADTVKGEKMYYINLVLQLKHGKQLEYKRYRLVLNRKGIKEIEIF